MNKYITAFVISLLLSLNASAQEKKFLLGFGSTSQIDTYLTPEHYSGSETRYLFDYRKKSKKDSLLYRSFTTELFVAYTRPRSQSSYNVSALLQLSYGMQHQIYKSDKARICLGGEADLFIGGIYNNRNGNNPAQLKTGIDIAPSISLDYKLRLFKKNSILKYKVKSPIVGLQFSPAYGQSYYEIFTQGNYDHNINLTTPVNAASLWHMLTIDVPLKRKAITFGYLGDYRQAALNNLKYHNYTHSLVIGITL